MSGGTNAALAAIYEGDWKLAEQIARKHLAEAPDDPDWLTPLAAALQMQRRWTETLAVVERALRFRENLTRPFQDGPRLGGMWIRGHRALRRPRPDTDFFFGWYGPSSDYAQAFTRNAMQMDAPIDTFPGSSAVPAGPVTDADVAALQTVIEAEAEPCEQALTQGEELLWLIAAVAPGDSRRALAQILGELFHSELEAQLGNPFADQAGYPFMAAFSAISVSEGAADVDASIQAHNETLREDEEYELTHWVPGRERLVAILSGYGYELSEESPKQSMRFTHRCSTQASFPAVVEVEASGTGYSITLFDFTFCAPDAQTAIRALAAAIPLSPEGCDVVEATLKHHLSMTEYEASAIATWQRTWDRFTGCGA